MKSFRGTETVTPGLYFNVRDLAFKSMEDTGRLPGTSDDVYRRVPVLAMLIVGPLLGLVYVMFLPFVGFAMVAWLLSVKAGRVAARAARSAARVLTPGWEPSLAFFSRPRTTKEVEAEAEGDAWAKAVRNRLDPPDRGAA